MEFVRLKYANNKLINADIKEHREVINRYVEKEGYVLVNDVELPVEKLFLNPHSPISYKSGTFFMSPAPFPKPFHLKVGSAEYERELLVTRIPNDSVNIVMFGCC